MAMEPNNIETVNETIENAEEPVSLVESDGEKPPHSAKRARLEI